MMRIVILAATFGFSISPVLAGAVSGPSALAVSGPSALSLATRIGQQSPLLTQTEKVLVSAYLDGCTCGTLQYGKKITVKADEVTCSMGDVDITSKGCELSFGEKGVSRSGSEAQALYATLIEARVPASGAAGTSYESITAIECTIDPAQFGTGGGADCTFNTNQ
jgi:hypothetical protein